MKTFYTNIQVRVAAVTDTDWDVLNSVGELNVEIDLAIFAAFCKGDVGADGRIVATENSYSSEDTSSALCKYRRQLWTRALCHWDHI